MNAQTQRVTNSTHRRCFIGGSDAQIIMGNDEAALFRLWREKRGEVEPEDLSGNLIVQLGLVTEDLNRRWYEANSGQAITDIQRQLRHPTLQRSSIEKVTPKKPGRPATGRDPVLTVRLPRAIRSAIENWAKQQHDRPSRSEAIRRLLELGLAAKATKRNS